MKDTVLVSMGVLALLVAMNNNWIYYLKGYVQASVGTGGAQGIINNAPNTAPATEPQFTQPGATAGTAMVNSPRPTSVGNQRLN
jgi:hypothetical protein